MWFAKHLKEIGLQCYNKNFGLKQLYSYVLLLNSVITKAQECEVSLKLKI